MNTSIGKVCVLIIVAVAFVHGAFSSNRISLSASASVDEPVKVTFNKHIAPILFKNCSSCHRPGEVAPFSLLNYRDAAKRAKQIAAVTKSRYMPPWKPEPGHGEFHDARRLTDQEIDLITRWAESGTLEGPPADLPPTPKFTDGWQLGEPDLILTMPEPFTVKAEGPDIYQVFVVPIDNPTDKFISGFEFRPGNRRVVHHSILFLDNNGAARRKDAADPDVGYRSFGGVGFLPTGAIGGWAPGAFPRFLPDGVANVIKKGSDLVIQMHYHPSGKTETDQARVGIYFAKNPPKKMVTGIPMIQRHLNIPAGEKRYQVTASFTVPIDVQAIGITPHMHLLGREMKVTAYLPDTTLQPMIWIKDWNFNWQDQYLYSKPVRLPKGTRLVMEAYYDNSSDNPRNPNNPPKPVMWGEQTTDEMAFCPIQIIAENQEEVRLLWPAILRQLIINGRSGKS
jgi:hypothetical protein